MQKNSEMKDQNDSPSLDKGNSRIFMPEDLLSECHVRLPVKSLIRFKAVNRPWRNLISSAGFAEMYLRRSKTNEQLLGVGLHPEQYYPVMSLLKHGGNKDAESGDAFSNISLPLVAQPLESVMIEGSCNGLLVFRTKSSPGIVLGNPATREFRHLSLPFDEARFSSIGHRFYEFCTSIGLCFISETNDYKIVAVRNIYGERSTSGTKSYSGWVYSLNSDSWKKLDVAFPYIKHRQSALNGMTTIFNECVHWLADGDEGRIAAFDVKNEVLQYMLLPVPHAQLAWGFGRLLTIIEGSLSLVVNLEHEVGYSGFEVWKMNEYGVEASWTKLLIINKFQMSVQPMGTWKDPMRITTQAVGSWKDRMILFKFYWGNGDLLFSYDTSTRKTKRFLMSPTLELQVINYVESLESVEGGMRRILQSRMMAADRTSHGNNSGSLSTGVVISAQQDNTKEDDSKGPASGEEKHIVNRTLESYSNNSERETSRKGKKKLE